nr:Chain C, Serine/threonine-protein kinase STE7 [synthetic construct]
RRNLKGLNLNLHPD